jgi:GNAT superfamily N-acetyltransferase
MALASSAFCEIRTMSHSEAVVIEIAPNQTAATWPVMRQLRPHLDLEQYLTAVARMRATDGFRLLAASVDGRIGAVAGFRTMEMLYCGRILSIDDLITDETMRSKGLGAALLDWLTREAQSLGCGQIHLDSGVQRLDAHRFYEREGFKKLGFHFAARIIEQRRQP